ncbi:glutamine--fructose-6-phosphate transaminase (isomerizing) [Prolixibacter denitrificans]|uniref:Glutamine--fructose-6-phosphate aminotransferase [isomerizing] n=1 Tax=Prolixibacter denitrificans TaxID=1541063 RepID=A0A2P8CHT2_9BACT|nr:glutamine--fructose-6-phosphate transaminase (isomerizing) [Prolixibacter denitrificans]PSK84538.1 glucosamine--fructose-6-phosphate aminotransferase (isomerizing) [Prolixibacter denitrificans]GET20709.1 glutamine--fructose-6-phosphate aminotransferase [isomerizing] [Prolixibacter denitrificans]
MCGIVGYIGDKNAYPILINGLKMLEYRGYDSSGIALLGDEQRVYKCQGKIANLEELVSDKDTGGKIGIGHTRWATHGEPTDQNAHPHTSMNGHFTLVHNGIIENYSNLRNDLSELGYKFQSETDTEVLVNLIEYVYLNSEEKSAEIAVRAALKKVVGAYGIVVVCKEEPNKLIAARKGSPLVIGIGNDEYFLASDATPIVGHTNQVLYLNDHDVAIIERGSLTLKNINNDPLVAKIKQVDLSIGELQKNGYDHFMLKEIFEQPNTIEQSFKGRIKTDNSDIVLGGLHNVMPKLKEARRLIIIGCGTSWHAGLVGEYLFEEYCRIPVEVEYASEFRYRNPIIDEDDVVIAISQSGETADTLAAVKLAKERGATVLGICNVVGSSIPRETDGGVYIHAGVEIGVASTKAFTAQVTILTMMAALLGKEKGRLSVEDYRVIIQELSEVPEKIKTILQSTDHIRKVADKYKDAVNALYLGRGALFPVALEGALKLKEVSYLHAEGYAAAEMKHGPIALVDDNLPVVVVAAKDRYYEKVVSNIQEVKARKGNIIAVVSEGDTQLDKMCDDIFEIPRSHPAVAPLLTIIPLQLFAYYVAILRGTDVDQPRNLAKSVTVE